MNDGSKHVALSFPNDYDYGFDENGDGNCDDERTVPSDQKPRILIMGLRKWVLS